MSIQLPPLRERAGDVQLLATHFVREFARKFQKNFTAITAEASHRLAAYPWPGNVRELRNLIERVVLLEEGQQIDENHLPAEWSRSRADLALVGSEAGASSDALGLPTLAQIEAEHIGEVLKLTAGNKSRAARILGISRQGLIEKLRRLRGETDLERQVR